MNLALFSFGSLKHLLALTDGTLPAISHGELVSRLQHLTNVFEIVCLGSSLDTVDQESFQTALEYESRILSDIETGVKEWTTMSRSIDSTCWTYAQKMAASSAENCPQFSDIGVKRCTSWNLFRKNGCQFEFLNPGKICKYLHCCSLCEQIDYGCLPHKVFECEHFGSPELDFDPPYTDHSAEVSE